MDVSWDALSLDAALWKYNPNPNHNPNPNPNSNPNPNPNRYSGVRFTVGVP